MTIAGKQKSIVTLVAIAALLLLALSSFSAMLANVFAHQSERVQAQWQRTGVASKGQLIESQAWLDKALFYSPHNPEYLDAEGSAYAAALSFGLPESQAMSDPALQSLRDAIEARPYWPDTWAQLAFLKAQLNQLDNEFWLAYTSAEAYGPWEAYVIESLLSATLHRWSELSWPQRRRAVALFDRAAHYPRVARQALDIAESSGMLIGLCYSLDKSSLPRWFVKRCEKTSR